MLSRGSALGYLCKKASQQIRLEMWQNQLWLKQKAAAEQLADSDEDDTGQFGIQGNLEEEAADTAAADAEPESDVYPLYGQDDSDFCDSSSEVGGLTPSITRPALIVVSSQVPKVFRETVLSRLPCADLLMPLMVYCGGSPLSRIMLDVHVYHHKLKPKWSSCNVQHTAYLITWQSRACRYGTLRQSDTVVVFRHEHVVPSLEQQVAAVGMHKGCTSLLCILHAGRRVRPAVSGTRRRLEQV